jgi:hypothetical protein
MTMQTIDITSLCVHGEHPDGDGVPPECCPSPVPGDVIVMCNSNDSLIPNGRRGIVDSSHRNLDFDDGKGPRLLTAFNVSGGPYGGCAFRGDGSSRYNTEGYVSASGGPCPLVPIGECVFAGRVVQKFWKWLTVPQGDGGFEYTATVNVWNWTRKERA